MAIEMRSAVRTSVFGRRSCRCCNGTARVNCLAITTLLQRYQDKGRCRTVPYVSHHRPAIVRPAMADRGAFTPSQTSEVKSKCSNKDIISSARVKHIGPCVPWGHIAPDHLGGGGFDLRPTFISYPHYSVYVE